MRSTFLRFLAGLGLLSLSQCAQDNKTFNQDDLANFTGSVSGQVLNRKGVPIPSVTITVSPGGNTTTTDGEGYFSLAKISEGAHQIRFMKADYRDTLLPDSVRLNLGDSATAAPQAMTYRYATVTGSVVDKNGEAQPMAGVAVQAQTASAMAMSEGKFQLSRIEPGTVKLFAALAGIGYGTKEITLGAEDSVDISSIALDHQGGTVSGTVVDATGASISGATISAVGGALTTLTNAQGQYTLATVPSDGSVQLTVTYKNQDVGTAFIHVDEGQAATLPNLVIGDGLGVGLLALLPSTQLVPSGAASLTLVAQAVWDTTDETNAPYWYIWSVDNGQTWDSTTTPFYTLEPQTFANLKRSTLCTTSNHCSFTVSTLAAALDGNQSKTSTITIVFPAADQDLPVPSSSSTVGSSSSRKGASLWDALHGNHGSSDIAQVLTPLGQDGGFIIPFSDLTSTDDGGQGQSQVTPSTHAAIVDSITQYGFLPIHFAIDQGRRTYRGYADMTFDFKDSITSFDVSSHPGLCVTYRSNNPIELDLSGLYGAYNYYTTSLPASYNWTSIGLPFNTSTFAQETGWGDRSTSLAQVLSSKLTGLKFEVQSYGTANYFLDLAQIGWQGECDTAGTGKFTRPLGSRLFLTTPPFTPGTKASLWDIANGTYGTYDGFPAYHRTVGISGDNGFWWYSYSDSNCTRTADGCPGSSYTRPHPNDFADTIAAYGYLHATLNLVAGTAKYPFSSIAFGLDSSLANVNISGKSGICLTYKSDKAISLRLGRPENYGDGNAYQITVPATTAASGSWVSSNFLFSNFTQETGWGTAVSRDSVLKNLVSAIEFHYKSKTPITSTASLDILQVGWTGECSAIAK